MRRLWSMDRRSNRYWKLVDPENPAIDGGHVEEREDKTRDSQKFGEMATRQHRDLQVAMLPKPTGQAKNSTIWDKEAVRTDKIRRASIC
jgi:hypothetical protein